MVHVKNRAVILLLVYYHLDYSLPLVQGLPGWNQWQGGPPGAQWGQPGAQWGQPGGQGGKLGGQWGNGPTNVWGQQPQPTNIWGQQPANGQMNNWGQPWNQPANGQWNNWGQPWNQPANGQWNNWGQPWNNGQGNNGNNNRQASQGQKSNNGGWPNWQSGQQQWPQTTTFAPHIGLLPKSNTNTNPVFPGDGFSSLWKNKVSPFSHLMFLSTMVGEGKDTICPQVQEGTPEYFADQTNLISDPDYLKELFNKQPHPPNRTTKTAQEFFKNFRPNGQHQFQPVLDQDIGDLCMNIKPCDPNGTLRTLTGECNNQRFPMWGVTGVNLVHIVPADYIGSDKIRVDSTGKALINARKLHLEVISNNPKESKTVSYAFMIFAQLISHDTARIMDQRPETGPTCLCCTNDGQMIPEKQRAAVCQPIEIAADDPFYSKFNVRCLNFVRSLTTNEMDCIIEPDQKLGDVSHFVDCSVLYGSTPKKCNSLRAFKDGLLRAEIENGREFMPTVDNPEKTCFKSPTCFLAGDDRCNQNPQLAVLHTIMFRFHNYVCRELLKLNPNWDDEKIFQVARIIVVATFQLITYEEMLPTLIGRQFAVAHNLSGITTLRNDLYQQFLNPATLVEFTSATDRLLHTMVPSKVKLCNKDGKVTEEHMLSDVFHNPHRVKADNKFNEFLYGMVYQAANEINTGVSTELTNLMFKSDQEYGLDLISMDIDRGREHGVTTYMNMRGACGLSMPKTFEDLIGIMTPENIAKLRGLYKNVADIDLFVGMYMEILIPGTLTGPLMQCIMAEQFLRWQAGDIFFYAFNNSNKPLTEEQLQEILKTSLSMLFCLCGDNIEQMPRNAFHLVGPGNEMVPCSKIPKISLLPWKEST